MSFSIAGKTAIVTGAANGIGLAIARQFAANGANVMCVDMDEAALEANFDAEDEDTTLRAFAGDLREKLTITNLISATIDAFDEINILVNASRKFGVTDPMNPEDETVAELMANNMQSALKLSRSVAKRMIKQGEEREDNRPLGAIVNLSSTAARSTRPDLMGYSVAAAAVNQMTRSLALTLAPHRIRVNAVALGSVMSASMKAALEDNLDWRGMIEHNTPLGRIGSPSELTDVVQFLASDASAFMTGDVLTVDGGRSLLDVVDVPAH